MRISRKRERFIMPSGVAAEVQAMAGINQATLTQTELAVEERLNRVLTDIVVSIEGLDLEAMTEKQKMAAINSLLEADKKALLVRGRQLSMGKPMTFELVYDWNDAGVNKKTKIGLQLLDEDSAEAAIEHICNTWGHAREIVQPLNFAAGMATKPYFKQFSKYPIQGDDLDYSLEIEINGIKNEFVFRLMTGAMNKKGLKQSEIDSHTKILLRLPRWKNENGDLESVNRKDLDSMDFPTLDTIRMAIEKQEGEVDTAVAFDHPNGTGKKVDTDVLGEISFFFPSGRI